MIKTMPRKGIVKSLNIDRRGSGSLLSADGREDIFFHVNDKGNKVAAGSMVIEVLVFLNPYTLATGRKEPGYRPTRHLSIDKAKYALQSNPCEKARRQIR
jgi:hypothetical protein